MSRPVLLSRTGPVRLGVLLLVLLTALLAHSPALGAEADRLEVTDMLGRRVAVPVRPARIVCLGPGALRLIVYLQTQDKVVGVESLEADMPLGRPYRLAHPELAKLPRVAPGGAAGINKKPDMEAVLAVKPEVIFAAYLQADTAGEIQKALGVPVVVLAYGQPSLDLPTFYGSLSLAGRIMGREARARQVIGYLEEARADLARRAAGGRPASAAVPRAYVGGLGFKGAHGIESTDPDYLPFVWLGVNNLAEKFRSRQGAHLFVDKETLLGLDPDYIFLDAGGLEPIKLDAAAKPEYYRGMRAFREGRAYVLLPFNHYTTNLDVALADAYAIGKILYPGGFTGLDPVQKADEIFTFLAGAPVYERLAGDFGALGRKADLTH